MSEVLVNDDGSFLEDCERRAFCPPEGGTLVSASPKPELLNFQEDDLAKLSRVQLNDLAMGVGLDGNSHTNKKELIKAIIVAHGE